jgi:hypothetical protein
MDPDTTDAPPGRKWDVQPKVHRAFRFTTDGVATLKLLARHYGASQVAVMELLMYREARRLKLLQPGAQNPARLTQAQLRAPYSAVLNRLPRDGE